MNVNLSTNGIAAPLSGDWSSVLRTGVERWWCQSTMWHTYKMRRRQVWRMGERATQGAPAPPSGWHRILYCWARFCPTGCAASTQFSLILCSEKTTWTFTDGKRGQPTSFPSEYLSITFQKRCKYYIWTSTHMDPPIRHILKCIFQCSGPFVLIVVIKQDMVFALLKIIMQSVFAVGFKDAIYESGLISGSLM